ncbi:FN3 associated domain-containing protein [Aureisphaera galaxeae]|uniref:FN3 associated domain-containing protein n=1 Tax=Aureisphaera galaxeae TaxID=1538023 RepID=UPI0023503287|nr:FN3 associated domain-containing protein [Aureisphaera galaxeae]MDC8006161.1 FN3 associated domain-containing protein [Aureisphaera galaxeae]
MKGKGTLYKRILIGILGLFVLAALFALQADEPPRFILFLGRFHPLLLHLPIGALVLAFFLDILGRIQKNYPSAAIKNILGFTTFFAIITCFLGYFLSLEGGYEENTLDWHLYTGILTALLTAVLFFRSLKASFHSEKSFLILFIISIISISVAGHFGSVLTHGDQFLFEYAGAAKKERTIEMVDSLKIYDDVVAKIFNDKCLQCHNATKMKGELSLTSEAAMLKGGETGTIFLKGNAEESLLYQQLLLPIHHEDHMPPEGKEQLTKDEIWLIKHWIDHGLDFKNYVVNPTENDTLEKLLSKYLVFNKIEIPKASKSDIEEIQAAGFRVLEIVPGEAALNIKYIDTLPSQETIDLLSNLKEQIVELDFGASPITDPMTQVFRKFQNLKTLRLNSDSITDASVKNFKNLKQLEVLNIYNTNITNKGLEALLGTIQPQQIYTWQTHVDRDFAYKMATDHNVTIHNNIQDGFVAIGNLKPPTLAARSIFFTDTLSVEIESKLKGVDIRYTLNGETPDSTSNVYDEKIMLDRSKTLKVATFKKGWLPSEIIAQDYTKILHTVPNYTMSKRPDERYAPAEKLFDMEEGTLSFRDEKWTGYFGYDVNATLDLGASKMVDHISFNCLEDVGSWILFPKRFTVYASNSPTGNFRKLGEVAIAREGESPEPAIKKVTLDIPETKARYFRIEIKNHDKLPDWHPSAGNPAWVFVDEIYFW